MRKGSCLAAAAVLCFLAGSCAARGYSTSGAHSADCMTARESVIKGNAVAAGYEMGADRKVAFVERVFGGLPVTAADCTRDYSGMEFCAIYIPPKKVSWDANRHHAPLTLAFHQKYPADVFEAKLLCRSRQDMIYQRYSYVIDGMQIVRIYNWYETGDEHIAVVFEPAETE